MKFKEVLKELLKNKIAELDRITSTYTDYTDIYSESRVNFLQEVESISDIIKDIEVLEKAGE